MKSIFLQICAAFFEIAGCFAFWAWLRLGKSVLWVLPGVLSLVVFALVLTCIESAKAGRAFAAYGGIYIAASLVWLWAVERQVPDRWDLLGATICLAGAAIIPSWAAVSGGLSSLQAATPAELMAAALLATLE